MIDGRDGGSGRLTIRAAAVFTDLRQEADKQQSSTNAHIVLRRVSLLTYRMQFDVSTSQPTVADSAVQCNAVQSTDRVECSEIHTGRARRESALAGMDSTTAGGSSRAAERRRPKSKVVGTRHSLTSDRAPVRNKRFQADYAMDSH